MLRNVLGALAILGGSVVLAGCSRASDVDPVEGEKFEHVAAEAMKQYVWSEPGWHSTVEQAKKMRNLATIDATMNRDFLRFAGCTGVNGETIPYTISPATRDQEYRSLVVTVTFEEKCIEVFSDDPDAPASRGTDRVKLIKDFGSSKVRKVVPV